MNNTGIRQMVLCVKCKKFFKPLLPRDFYNELYRDRERESQEDAALMSLYGFNETQLEHYRMLNGYNMFFSIGGALQPERECLTCRVKKEHKEPPQKIQNGPNQDNVQI